MVLIRPIAQLHSFEKLIGDLRISGSREERGEPVETREDSVRNGARLDMTRPTRDAWSSEAAFHDGPLRTFKGRHAAVRPGKDLGTVVGAENEDGVIGFADVVQVLH